MGKRILILYTSIGLGHKTIAQNIGQHLKQGGFEVRLFDVLELQNGLLVELGKSTHSFINRRLPFVWKWLYTNKWFTDLTLGGRVKIAGRNYAKVKAVIDEFQPDLVITTQTTASAVVEFMKQQGVYRGQFAIAFSDYHLHRYWLYDSVDLYLCNIEEQKQEMIRLGILADKILVCGMTLPSLAVIDVSAIRAKLDLAPEDKVILVGSGSLGFGGLSEMMLGQLAEMLSPHKVHLFILTGKNQELYETLNKSLTKHKNLRILGFYSPMDELYAISSMILSKPGGLTVAETLQWGLPMLITHWLPGQEEINYKYLTGKRLVMPKPALISSIGLYQQIMAELNDSGFHRLLLASPERGVILQLDREGKTLISGVQNLFHKV